MISCMSSGSCRADNAVEPRRSQNRTVRCLRSASLILGASARIGFARAVMSGSCAMARKILRRWPNSTPIFSRSRSEMSARTFRSMACSRKVSAYCPRPKLWSHAAIVCCMFDTRRRCQEARAGSRTGSWRRRAEKNRFRSRRIQSRPPSASPVSGSFPDLVIPGFVSYKAALSQPSALTSGKAGRHVFVTRSEL